MFLYNNAAAGAMKTTIPWRCISLGSAILMAAAAAMAQEAKCDPPPIASCALVKQKMSALLKSRGPETCYTGAVLGPNCKNLKIKVYPKNLAEGRAACIAELQYDRLNVKTAKNGRTVTWKLDVVGSLPGYEFLSREGIKLVPPSGAASAPDVWHLPAVTQASNQTVVLKAKGKPAAEWCHYPQVKAPDGEICCPVDPVISNDPS